MTDKNYIYKKLSDGRYIKEIDNKVEHLASSEEDSKLATDIRSLLQGPQGLDGTSGTSGQDGTSGKDGQKGDIGRTGLTGPRGLNGTSGSSGSSGQDGTSGVNGQDGTSGQNGRKGDKGEKGDRGFPGLQGPMGAKGEDGVIGTSGTSGVNGLAGSTGSSGTSGVNGTSGLNGSSGTSGVSGSSGTSGISGSNILASVLFSGNIIAPILMNTSPIASVAISPLGSIFLAPFVFPKQTVVTSFSYDMATIAAGNARIYIYSDFNGKPLNKLVESSTLSTGSSLYKTYTSTFTFSAGVTYWQGIQSDITTVAFRSSAAAATTIIGFPPTQGNLAYTSYIYTATTFNLPSSLTQSSLTFRSSIVPIVFMTVA